MDQQTNKQSEVYIVMHSYIRMSRALSSRFLTLWYVYERNTVLSSSRYALGVKSKNLDMAIKKLLIMGKPLDTKNLNITVSFPYNHMESMPQLRQK